MIARGGWRKILQLRGEARHLVKYNVGNVLIFSSSFGMMLGILMVPLAKVWVV
jgi:hypothetical protein